ncbi:hypothetical protein ARAM_003659 [Aspergillus rambellii]|uniref:RRM domain-containing protein n=1 Tax=Aspergillus rambellii TaxID=308745 RepID=A0A0F8UFG5_9EURO|nr:hypothetical protein ARAM_003659 [Aspergillus rambellii]
MNPFSPVFVPGFPPPKGQCVTEENTNKRDSSSNNTTPIPPHSLPLWVMNPQNSIIHNPSAGTRIAPYPSSMAQSQHRHRQVEIVSPISQRTACSLLQDLNKLDIQDIPESSPNFMCTENVDKVTDPSKMPIGSLVHLMEPPKLGVIKISNIPYSITKQEIFQFLGRPARLITPDRGCPVHIIMERSTAKTMECYAEFETPSEARETVVRINRIYETGRAPRLGNRHVDLELSNQDALLKDLFPRAKCVVWRDGMPYVMPNTDPYSTGFTGFFTTEEIIGAIRHAEMPHRSPFCDKCPQRTYESTISTIHKFPWYATELYTVHDRNQLFELVNRHIISLVSRVKRTNTVGLDQKLLHDLLQAGLKCPAFNERQKYTLCIHSENVTEIFKFPEIGKWFPFDTLVKMPGFKEDVFLYYVSLISQGSVPNVRNSDLPNMFSMPNPGLQSPYGEIWFEWPLDVTKNVTWGTAVHHEMVLLSSLVLSGWINDDKNSMNNITSLRRVSEHSSSSIPRAASYNMHASSSRADKLHARTESTPHADALAPTSRRASESTTFNSLNFESNEDTGNPWNQKLLLYPPTRPHPGFRGHRITQSSPNCLPSPTENWPREN